MPGEKPLGAEQGTNNKFNPHMTKGRGGGALTTAPSLLPRREMLNSDWLRIALALDFSAK